MADTKISALTAASAAALANEFPINEAGTTKKVTGTQIATLLRTGTTTNDNASAGQIGEVLESTVLVGSAVSLTTVTAADVTSISLTAGDWDVWGIVDFIPGGTTTIASVVGWIHTTSASFPTLPNGGAYAAFVGSLTTGGAQHLPVGMRRYSLSGTTTVYLTAYSSFGVSTMAAYGYLGARRRR